jgi:UDP-glucose 4-epimerase
LLNKILVTGGAGFIGSHLVDHLVGEGYSVRVLDNLSSGSLKNIANHLKTGKVDFIKGDICDGIAVKRSVENIDAVFHLAAQISVPASIKDPNTTFNTNLAATVDLLNASVQAHIKKFLFASSCAVYGDSHVLPISEKCVTNPISPYAESKLIAERYCLGFSERKLLETVVFRFFNVYGPRQGMNDYSGVITRFIERSRQGLPLVIYGDGLQTRDFVNVQDIVQALMSGLKCSTSNGEAFNVGTGKPSSVKELAELIMHLTSQSNEIQYEKPRAGDILESYADVSKAKNLLGYSPKVMLGDGLQALLRVGG